MKRKNLVRPSTELVLMTSKLVDWRLLVDRAGWTNQMLRASVSLWFQNLSRLLKAGESQGE